MSKEELVRETEVLSEQEPTFIQPHQLADLVLETSRHFQPMFTQHFQLHYLFNELVIEVNRFILLETSHQLQRLVHYCHQYIQIGVSHFVDQNTFDSHRVNMLDIQVGFSRIALQSGESESGLLIGREKEESVQKSGESVFVIDVSRMGDILEIVDGMSGMQNEISMVEEQSKWRL